MFIERPPLIVHWLYPKAECRVNKHEKVVYLTFDDGPIPEITPWVLDLLDHYGIKATFFLVGDNVRKHPDEFRMILVRGHRVGNHTQNPVRGSSRTARPYLRNVERANRLIQSDLFRPPYGYMGYAQYHSLKRKYRIIMWDVVTRDYSKHLNGEQVFNILKKYVRKGSIITFHDSKKAERNLRYALPRSIEWLLEQGYRFELL